MLDVRRLLHAAAREPALGQPAFDGMLAALREAAAYPTHRPRAR